LIQANQQLKPPARPSNFIRSASASADDINILPKTKTVADHSDIPEPQGQQPHAYSAKRKPADRPMPLVLHHPATPINAHTSFSNLKSLEMVGGTVVTDKSHMASEDALLTPLSPTGSHIPDRRLSRLSGQGASMHSVSNREGSYTDLGDPQQQQHVYLKRGNSNNNGPRRASGMGLQGLQDMFHFLSTVHSAESLSNGMNQTNPANRKKAGVVGGMKQPPQNNKMHTSPSKTTLAGNTTNTPNRTRRNSTEVHSQQKSNNTMMERKRKLVESHKKMNAELESIKYDELVSSLQRVKSYLELDSGGYADC
jgi:hypothetical protein